MNTYQLEVVSNEYVATDTYQMVVCCPDSFIDEFKPGQFVHIKIPNAQHLTLRRPLGVHSISDHTMTMVYKIIGKGTQLLSNCKTHDFIDVLGPIGNHFEIPENAEKIALVGGGLGVAPLLSLPITRSEFSYTAFIGYGNVDAVYASVAMENACDKVHLCTDDGSCGIKGNAVAAFEKYLEAGNTFDVIMSCGPVPMMKALREIANKHNIKCFLSLEERMGCGYGSCLTCVCKTKDEHDHEQYSRVCIDGPVFEANEVIFDD